MAEPARSTGAATLLLIGAVAAAMFWLGQHSAAEALAATPPAASVVPRAVVARGELAADERNNIDVFKSASPSVVHITTLERAASLFSIDATQVPRGTGTGFMWDDHGHIV
ncbi:MAG TPA: 2-alkenal reductase, partial [Burkholderiaceae bacterium]|nr:2-alkenal reductase [Burkholderiaceae bacterium]